MKSSDMKILDYCDIPPRELEAAVGSLTGEELSDLEDEGSALLQRLSFVYRYIEERRGYGCGDQGHVDAVRRANKMLAAVRTAMGYTYPKSNQINI